jgi:hypothetical protein
MRSPFAANPISEFDKLVATLAALDRRYKWARELTARARGDGHRGEFRKALSALEDMHKALPPKRRTVILKGAPEPSADAEVIAKAFHTLQHGNLNADQRGRLMLALGNLTDRVVFAKAHPMIGHIDSVIARLDAAHADNHAEIAEPFLEDAEDLLASGKLTQADHARLTTHLLLIKDRIKDHDRAKKA